MQQWAFFDRSQLPEEYKAIGRIHGWWTAEGLEEEHRLANDYGISWSLRGPPEGPEPGSPSLWRGKKWAANARQWKMSGGASKVERLHKYGKAAAKHF